MFKYCKQEFEQGLKRGYTTRIAEAMKDDPRYQGEPVSKGMISTIVGRMKG